MKHPLPSRFFDRNVPLYTRIVKVHKYGPQGRALAVTHILPPDWRVVVVHHSPVQDGRVYLSVEPFQ
jgi:hypothetical protein